MNNNEHSNGYHYEKVPVKENNGGLEEERQLHYGYGKRHIQSFLLFVCLSIGFIARGHLGVTIVAMTNMKNITENYIISSDVIKKLENSTIANKYGTKSSTVYDFNETNPNVKLETVTNNNAYYESLDNKTSLEDTGDKWNVYRTYKWPKSVQEMILGSFFLGYCIMMFPIGLVCQRWGGKVLLQIALSVNGVVSILTPWLAVWGGWKAVCMCRIMQGLSQAGFYPGIHTFLANWVPLSERGSLSSYVYTGTTFGTVVAFQLSGLLSDSQWGWPSTFWVTGVLCIFMFTILTMFGAATPKDHKTITDDEKNFILGRIDDGIKKKHKTPWKAILSSKHVWAAIAAHTGYGMGFVFFFMQVPTYMHYILGVNIKSSGLLSSLPYVACFFMCIAFGWVSDFCTNRKILSVKSARQISNTIAQVGPAICLAAVSFTKDTALGVASLVVALGLQAGVHTGWMINYIDLAPEYSGTLMATGNTFTNVFVLTLPVLVSNIVTDMTNQHQWRILFFLMAGITVVANTVFVIFMSSEEQPWNKQDQDTFEQQENEMEAQKRTEKQS